MRAALAYRAEQFALHLAGEAVEFCIQVYEFFSDVADIVRGDYLYD